MEFKVTAVGMPRECQAVCFEFTSESIHFTGAWMTVADVHPLCLVRSPGDVAHIYSHLPLAGG